MKIPDANGVSLEWWEGAGGIAEATEVILRELAVLNPLSTRQSNIGSSLVHVEQQLLLQPRWLLEVFVREDVLRMLPVESEALFFASTHEPAVL